MREANLTNGLGVLRRRWWLVLISVVLTPLVAWVASIEAPKKWTATAELLFRDPGFDQKLFGSSFFAPSGDPAREAATNVRLVSLETVFARAARALGGSTPQALSDMVSVHSQGQSDVVAIEATAGQPRMAERVANVVAAQYIAFRREADRSTILRALQPVDNELRSLRPRQRGGVQGVSLQDRAEQLRILASLQTGNAELVQPAQVPARPSSPHPLRNVVIGLLLGGIVGLLVAMLAERLDTRLRDPSEVEHLVGRPLLTEVPNSRELKSGTAGGTMLHGADLEAFRTLRTALRFLDVGRPVRSVVVTSAVPGEGKSTVSMNLALTAALAGSPTILLEADLRRPSLARALGLTGRAGLAGVLLGDVTLDDAIQHYKSNGNDRRLAVICAGGAPPNPSELLASDRMSEVIDELEQRFELLVIDSPPLSVVSDAVPLTRRASGTLIVVRNEHSTRPAIRDLRRRLDTLGITPLGVVLNSVDRASTYYHYDGYHHVPTAMNGDRGQDGREPTIGLERR